MYLLFRFHHVMPHTYKKLGPGEKHIVSTFMYREMEDMRKEAQSE
jgi:hypothetical protein